MSGCKLWWHKLRQGAKHVSVMNVGHLDQCLSALQEVGSLSLLLRSQWTTFEIVTLVTRYILEFRLLRWLSVHHDMLLKMRQVIQNVVMRGFSLRSISTSTHKIRSLRSLFRSWWPIFDHFDLSNFVKIFHDVVLIIECVPGQCLTAARH